MDSAVFAVGLDHSLSLYLQEIRKYPLLSMEEEQSLARRWRDANETDAAHKLVTSHLRLVAKIAMGYRGYGLPVGELIGEGNVGLMRAVNKFDPELGFRFATYAIWWIRAAIQEYILQSSSMVKIGTTRAQKKLFFNLRRVKGQLQAIDGGDLGPEQVSRIAHLLDVSEKEVIFMDQHLALGDHSLNAPRHADSEGEWQDWLVDETESVETGIAERQELEGGRALLSGALDALNERERRIFVGRRLRDNPVTLEQFSQELGISRERVRQIEMHAFEKVQKIVKGQIIKNKLAKDRALGRDRASAVSRRAPMVRKQVKTRRHLADAGRLRLSEAS